MTGTSTTDPATGESASGGRFTVACPLSVGDGQLGGDRVLAVGHDLEVEVVEGERLARSGTAATGRPGGRPRTRAPRSWTGRCRGWPWRWPAGRWAGGRASRPRCRCSPSPAVRPRRSISSSGMSGETRAWPVRRTSGPSAARRSAAATVSVSERGGAPEARSRVMTSVRRSYSDEAPVARRRSWGIDTVSSTVTPGMPDLGEADRAARADR